MTTTGRLHGVVLGDNQFFAVNHMSQERSFAQAERFGTDGAILAVMRAAYDRGVRAMMLHSHPRAESLCEHVRSHPGDWKDFALYPTIPYAFKYVMALNEKGFYPVIMDQIKKAGVGASLSMFLSGGLGVATKDYFKLLKVLVDLEMQIFRGLETPAVFLHNVVVDLILALEIDGLLAFFADHVREKHGARPAFGSLNVPLLVHRLEVEGITDALIMTSVNSIGFFMNPSQAACEETLRNPDLDVMAMSILASGAIPASEAFAYAAQFPAVKSLLFGASRAETLDKSLAIIRSLDARFATA
jgi:hypothetical protein